MLCNECGKNQANIHTMQYINGVKTELHLCPDCAKKNHPELQKMGAVSASELFQNLFNFSITGPDFSTNNDEVCPTCKERLSDFKKTGLLGCPDCYDTHRDAIIPVLQRTHGTAQHMGDVPKEAEEARRQREKLEDLQAKLKAAVEAEAFEDAAKLRDEINALKDGEG